ncbi:MAG: hypothetical protein IJG80_08245 [Selenomonadaceae bacterium]|nr:hypothetical protein [Selenomonadaceae bacterium]
MNCLKMIHPPRKFSHRQSRITRRRKFFQPPKTIHPPLKIFSAAEDELLAEKIFTPPTTNHSPRKFLRRQR